MGTQQYYAPVGEDEEIWVEYIRLSPGAVLGALWQNHCEAASVREISIQIIGLETY